VQSTDWYASFCEVIGKTICPRWVLTKRIVFPLRAVIAQWLNLYHLDAQKERGDP
jgi:hypothetical protein